MAADWPPINPSVCLQRLAVATLFIVPLAPNSSDATDQQNLRN